tara:strand:+ start:744 stop:1154 length:411 start_codon:yes stop_codon:yes gene_type:complete
MHKITRKDFIFKTSAAAAGIIAPIQLFTNKQTKRVPNMYGLIGKITATDGQRDNLINILLEGTRDMPGCLSYIISKDSKEDDVIWVTEVWKDQESHRASLSLPAVQEAIGKGRPMIAEFGEQIETVPAGGHGLAST